MACDEIHTYEQGNTSRVQFCYQTTGHVEAIQVEFDPNEVSYEDLVDVFWSLHNPTIKNRQG
jgi:peptide-methionine (S)-S-oxide reductase